MSVGYGFVYPVPICRLIFHMSLAYTEFRTHVGPLDRRRVVVATSRRRDHQPCPTQHLQRSRHRSPTDGSKFVGDDLVDVTIPFCHQHWSGQTLRLPQFHFPSTRLYLIPIPFVPPCPPLIRRGGLRASVSYPSGVRSLNAIRQI